MNLCIYYWNASSVVSLNSLEIRSSIILVENLLDLLGIIYGTHIRWQLKIRCQKLTRPLDMLKAVVYLYRNYEQFNIFKRSKFLNTCGTSSGLPSYTSTMILLGHAEYRNLSAFDYSLLQQSLQVPPNMQSGRTKPQMTI